MKAIGLCIAILAFIPIAMGVVIFAPLLIPMVLVCVWLERSGG
jgi:hypothetical protein